MAVVHGLLWFFGVYPVPAGTSGMYQLWSGFIPALAIMSLLGGLYQHFKHINCHVRPCWRIGRYEAGPYRVCARHHPRDDVSEVTPEMVSKAYYADPAKRVREGRDLV